MTSAVKNSEITAAATMAMLIESSIVLRRDRQGKLLPIGDPYACTEGEAYGHRVLQAGDLDQSLRAEPWLPEVTLRPMRGLKRVSHAPLGCASLGCSQRWMPCSWSNV